MSSFQRVLSRSLAFSLLAFLSLACCLDCPSEPERNVCDEGASSAVLSTFRFLDDDPTFSQSGFVLGGQGSQMLTARFVFEGELIPDCAEVSVSAETVGAGRNVWAETVALETEDRAAGGRQSRGTLFRVFESNDPDDCMVRITATAYGQTAELITESTSFVCTSGAADAGMNDAGADDAGTSDAGASDAGF